MAVYGKKLLDNEGNTILPKTRSNLVYMSDDNTVEDTIEKIKSGEIVVGKAADTNQLVGRMLKFDSNNGMSVAPLSGDYEFLDTVPYYVALRARTMLTNRYGDALNTFGSYVYLEEYAENNVFFWDFEAQKKVYPQGRDDTKFPVSGGTFTGAVKAAGSLQSGLYVRNINTLNSSWGNVATDYLVALRT